MAFYQEPALAAPSAGSGFVILVGNGDLGQNPRNLAGLMDMARKLLP